MLPIAIIILLAGFVPTAFAVTPLDVGFVPNPLFNKPNFLPGDATSGEVTVTNNSGSTQTLLTEAINIFDDDNFGSLLHLNISGSNGVIFDDSLAQFFATAGEVSLGTLANGQSAVFDYTISFIDSDDNSYQGKALGFDVCVGFQGGNIHCGNTTVGDEGGGSGGGSGGGTGGGLLAGSGGDGGGSVVPITLAIFNEQALNISNVGQSGLATIVWDTNKLATSQVVYGLASGGPYTLDLNAPYFGYPFGTTEDPTKVIHHSVLLAGLTPGQVYVYRVVSRASPPTISFEHQFTVPLLAQANNPIVTGENSSYETSDGAVLGNSTTNASENVSVQTQEEGTASAPTNDSSDTNTNVENNATALNNNLALVYASGFGDILSLCTLVSLIILFAIYIVWLLLRRKYEKDMIQEQEIRNRFFIFFGSASVFVAVLLSIFGQYCPVPILLGVSVICFVIYIYRKFFRTTGKPEVSIKNWTSQVPLIHVKEKVNDKKLPPFLGE